MCNHKMAEQMEPVIAGAGGEISEKDVRSYCVVMFVRKKAYSAGEEKITLQDKEGISLWVP
jgi:hypothetical protein